MSVEHANLPGGQSSRGLTIRPWTAPSSAPGTLTDRIAVDLYIAFEIATIAAAGLLLGKLYVADMLGVTGFVHDYLAPLVAVPLTVAFNINRHGLYGFGEIRRFPVNAGAIARSIAIAFAVLVLAGFVMRIANDYSRVWLVGWCLLSIAAVTVLRSAAAGVFAGLSDAGVIQKTVVIYGHGAAAEEVAEQIRNSRTGIRLAATFNPEGPGSSGSIADLVGFAQSHPVDSVILALPGADPAELEPILRELRVLPGDVQFYPGVGGARIPLRGISMLDRMALLDVQRKAISGWGVLAKAVEDYVVAGVALVLLAPVFAAIALAIRLDSPGPVFFLQRRHGYNHKIIKVWKFRTMRVLEDGDVVVQARRDDERVTRVGAFLRRTSLDELPQLFNVLKGEMSIVGPRPHALAHNAAYVPLLAHYQERHRVKPGITGWAQVNGYRGPTEDPELMRKRVEYDLDYIENWSLWLDLKIIAATPIAGLVHRNAL